MYLETETPTMVRQADIFSVWGVPSDTILKGMTAQQIKLLKSYVEGTTEQAYRIGYDNGVAEGICKIRRVLGGGGDAMSDHQKALFLSQAIIKTCLEFFPDREEFSPPIVMTAIAHAMAFGLVEEFEVDGEAIRAMSKMLRPMLKHHRHVVAIMNDQAERKPPKLELVWDREKA